jgi:hypothetical protein
MMEKRRTRKGKRVTKAVEKMQSPEDGGGEGGTSD